MPAFPAGGGRKSLRLGVKDAVSRLLPSWNRLSEARKGQRRRKKDGKGQQPPVTSAFFVGGW